MRVTIYQPQYFPRLHYFNRIMNSDVFVILDSAQYTKSLVHFGDVKKRHKSYQADCVIKKPEGEFFLTVPVKHGGLKAISEVEIDYAQNWIFRHLSTIKAAYGKSFYYNTISGDLREIISEKHIYLADLNIKTILWGICKVLDFKIETQDMNLDNVNKMLEDSKEVRLKKILRDRETGVKRPKGFSKGTEWTGMICKSVGATEYLHGETAKAGYMDLGYYKKLGIKPVVQNWRCATYTQRFSETVSFIPNLSIIDLLLNVSQKEANGLLLS